VYITSNDDVTISKSSCGLYYSTKPEEVGIVHISFQEPLK